MYPLGMKDSLKERKSGKDWCKTPYSKLWRYLPSNTLYARIKVAGKLHVKSLKTDVVTVGAARLADFEKTLATYLRCADCGVIRDATWAAGFL